MPDYGLQIAILSAIRQDLTKSIKATPAGSPKKLFLGRAWDCLQDAQVALVKADTVPADA